MTPGGACANPVGMHHPPRVETPRPGTGAGRPGLILVVDDERSVRALIHRVLERTGFEVRATPSPTEAIDLARRNPISLVVTDLMMPGMTGMEMAHEIRSTHAWLPVLLVSGTPHARTLLIEPPSAFLAKPFSVADLVRVATSMIGARRAGVSSRDMTGRHDRSGQLPEGSGMPYRGEATAVLAMWRDIERRIVATPRESPEFVRLADEWARLRLEYARLTDLAAQHQRPPPTAWPVAASAYDPKRGLADRSSEMLDDLAHLRDTEEQKRREPVSTAPFHALADDVSAPIRRVTRLGERSDELGDEAETGEGTIEDIERAG